MVPGSVLGLKQAERMGILPSSADYDSLMIHIPDPIPPSPAVVTCKLVAARPGSATEATIPVVDDDRGQGRECRTDFKTDNVASCRNLET